MDFQKDVIEKSQNIPVVVDFWAPWCAPCRVLGPVIEQLANEQSDHWSLEKVNTEEDSELAMEYGIRSIPNVKMFFKGEVIAEFAGALPRHMIVQWLNEYLPSAEKMEWVRLKTELEEKPGEDQIKIISDFLEKYPDFEEARLVLATQIVFVDTEKAVQLVETIKMGHIGYDRAEDIRAYHEFTQVISNDKEVSRNLAEGSRFFKDGDIDSGILSIIQAVKTDKSFQNDLPRRIGIAIFHLLGDHHELTKKYRRTFDMALY